MRKYVKQREDNELAVFARARDLISYTLRITNNPERFPKKVRFTITNRIQDKVITLYECLLEANEIPRDNPERINLQRKALILCKNLLFLVDLSFEQGYISPQSVEHWSKLILNVKRMTAQWMQS